MASSAANSQMGNNTTLDCLVASTSWVEALHGHGEMAAVMNRFVRLFDCEAALLVRIAPGGQSGKCLAKAIADSQKLFPPRAASPLIHEIVHPDFAKVDRGTVWQYSDPDDRAMWKNSHRLEHMMYQEAVSDVAIIALDTKSTTWDFLEFHFTGPIPGKTLKIIKLLSRCLANPWASRLPGLAVNFQMGMRLIQSPDPKQENQVPILDFRNPAGLSRGELRVCSLVRKGLRVTDIASELAIQTTTVRSHLHSIFSKTETSGQVELLHRLSQFEPDVGRAVG